MRMVSSATLGALRVFVAGVAISLSASWPRAEAWAEQSSRSDRVVIAVAGDVLPESSWEAQDGTEHFLDGVREEFSRADLVFVNLEEPITSAKTVTPHKSPAEVARGRDYILRARNPEIPRIMKDAGVGLVGLANNHMMDFTDAGLRDTLAVLGRAQLPAVGAGIKSDAERAYVFEKDGRRVALLAFSDVVPTSYQATVDRMGIASSKDETDLVMAIGRARRQAQFVVLMIHWGGQGKHLITPRQRHLARVAAQAGCDAVMGMHPHVLQGMEYVGRVPVFYSLGNFAFPSTNPAARESLLVSLTFGPRDMEAPELIPVEISPKGAPRIAEGGRGRQILARLDGFCHMFNTRVEGGKLIHAGVRGKLVLDPPRHRARRGTVSTPGL